VRFDTGLEDAGESDANFGLRIGDNSGQSMTTEQKKTPSSNFSNFIIETTVQRGK
jgi:hypothetical protein